MRSLVILGGGGHAKVVVDVFRSAGSFNPIGYTAREPGPPLAGDVPYLGTDQHLSTLRDKVLHAFVAIGNNATRLAIGKVLAAQGFRLPPAVSAHAVVSPSARIGRGALIMPGAIVNSDATIGDFAIVNTAASIDHDSVVGPGAHIAPGSSVCGSVLIGELAFVGVGASIIPGVIVGPRAIVGAGAAVVRDVPSDMTVVGVPARPVSRSGQTQRLGTSNGVDPGL